MEPVYAIYADRSAVDLLSALKAEFSGAEYVVVEQAGDDPAAEFRSDLEERRAAGSLGGCCVLTRRPSAYKGRFTANDVLDASGVDSAKIPDSVRFVLSGGRSSRKCDVDSVFFCSDLHLNHANIVRYCSRPWNSGTCATGELAVTDDDVRRMNDDLVSNWNSVVSKDATVWFLGDFCLGKDQRTAIPGFVSRLNGRISIVLGNHDRHSMKFYYDAGFKAVYDRPVVWNSCFILSHAPVQWVRDGSVWGNLHGHVHNMEMFRHVTANTYNCCVEVNGYRPVSFAEIKRKMSEYEESRKAEVSK